MAEAMLIGAGIGAGTSMLSGQDPLKGAALGGAMGGASAGFGSAGVTSGATSGAATAAANGSMVPLASQQVASNAALSGVGGAGTAAANGSMTPLSSQGMFGGMGNMASNAMDGFTDLTGMTGQDLGGMAFNKGVSSLSQPEQQQQIQAAPMGQGISRPQVDLSQSQGSLLSSNPMTSGAGGQQLTPEKIQMLQQKGLL